MRVEKTKEQKKIIYFVLMNESQQYIANVDAVCSIDKKQLTYDSHGNGVVNSIVFARHFTPKEIINDAMWDSYKRFCVEEDADGYDVEEVTAENFEKAIAYCSMFKITNLRHLIIENTEKVKKFIDENSALSGLTKRLSLEVDEFERATKEYLNALENINNDLIKI